MLLPTAVDMMMVGGLDEAMLFNCNHHLVDVNTAPSLEALEHALTCAIAAWPVLGCRYDDAYGRPRFEPLELRPANLVSERTISFEEVGAATEQFIAQPLDIRRESPLRVLVLRHERGARIVVTMHHGVSDGLGGFELMRILGAFAYEGTDAAPQVGERSVAKLLVAENKAFSWKVLRAAAREIWGMNEIGRLSKEGIELGKPKGGDVRIATHEWVIDERGTQTIIERAGGAVNLNASLIAASLMTTLAFARRAGNQPRRLGIFFVVNQRLHFSTGRRTLANLGSFKILPIEASELDDMERAMRAVTRSIERAVRDDFVGIGPFLLMDLAAAVLPSRVVRSMVTQEPQHLPAVFPSFAGQVDGPLSTFGNALTNYAVMSSPAAPMANPQIDMSLCRRRLTFTSCYDKRCWSELDVVAFSTMVRGLMSGEHTTVARGSS